MTWQTQKYEEMYWKKIKIDEVNRTKEQKLDREKQVIDDRF